MVCWMLKSGLPHGNAGSSLYKSQANYCSEWVFLDLSIPVVELFVFATRMLVKLLSIPKFQLIYNSLVVYYTP